MPFHFGPSSWVTLSTFPSFGAWVHSSVEGALMTVVERGGFEGWVNALGATAWRAGSSGGLRCQVPYLLGWLGVWPGWGRAWEAQPVLERGRCLANAESFFTVALLGLGRARPGPGSALILSDRPAPPSVSATPPWARAPWSRAPCPPPSVTSSVCTTGLRAAPGVTSPEAPVPVGVRWDDSRCLPFLGRRLFRKRLMTKKVPGVWRLRRPPSADGRLETQERQVGASAPGAPGVRSSSGGRRRPASSSSVGQGESSAIPGLGTLCRPAVGYMMSHLGERRPAPELTHSDANLFLKPPTPQQTLPENAEPHIRVSLPTPATPNALRVARETSHRKAYRTAWLEGGARPLGSLMSPLLQRGRAQSPPGGGCLGPGGL